MGDTMTKQQEHKTRDSSQEITGSVSSAVSLETILVATDHLTQDKAPYLQSQQYSPSCFMARKSGPQSRLWLLESMALTAELSEPLRTSGGLGFQQSA